MEKLIKNLEHAKPLILAEQVTYEDGKVVSQTLSQRPGIGITLFAFDTGESISTHAAPGDAMAYILEGEAEIIIDDVIHKVEKGEVIVMPESIPHSVKAKTRFKMLLVVIKP